MAVDKQIMHEAIVSCLTSAHATTSPAGPTKSPPLPLVREGQLALDQTVERSLIRAAEEEWKIGDQLEIEHVLEGEAVANSTSCRLRSKFPCWALLHRRHRRMKGQTLFLVDLDMSLGVNGQGKLERRKDIATEKAYFFVAFTELPM